MKAYILPIFILYLTPAVSAQTPTMNYIQTITPKVETSTTAIHSLTTGQALHEIQYFDEAGRLIQMVERDQTPGKADIVSALDLSGDSQILREFLPVPVTGNQGNYLPLKEYERHSEATYADSKAYKQYEYDHSPLNEMVKQTFPGESWILSGKGVCHQRPCNVANDKVRIIKLIDGKLNCNTFYPKSFLFANKVTDEDGNLFIEFTDKTNRKILTRQIQETINYDTYYVYDRFDNLRVALPPLACDELFNNSFLQSGNFLDKYAYIYRYDCKKRMIMKKLPGADSINYVYDKTNRLIFCQDGNLRTVAKWIFYKYDALGREIMQGLVCDSRNRETLAEAYKNIVVREKFLNNNPDNSYWGYSCSNSLPGEVSLLSLNFYDNYGFLSNIPKNNLLHPLVFQNKSGYDAKSENTQGLLCGNCTFALHDDTYEIAVHYYDWKSREIQTRTEGSFYHDNVYTRYNFSNQPVTVYKEHVSGYGNPEYYYTNQSMYNDQLETYEYEYDHAGRLTGLYHTYATGGDTAVITNRFKKPRTLLLKNTYNELGQLIEKQRCDGKDTTKYTYNIRGWITRIEGKEFKEELNYQEQKEGVTPCYNGNISRVQITQNGHTYSYHYTYDKLNRLQAAIQTESGSAFNAYSEEFDYDNNGNIVQLRRTDANAQSDNLSMLYNGNQLLRVRNAEAPLTSYGTTQYPDKVDLEKEYFYDKNGNQTANLDKDIVAVRYNLLNLPDTIQFKNGNMIINNYLSNGNKTKTEYKTFQTSLSIPFDKVNRSNDPNYSFTVEYDGNYIYHNKKMASIRITDGYLRCKPFGMDGKRYFYYCLNTKDHLGNVRTVWHAEYPFNNAYYQEPEERFQSTEYYASGLPYDRSRSPEMQPYKFGEKEYITMHGLNQHNSLARMQECEIPYFTTIDPMCEKYYSVTPYAYCMNNPVNMIDPDGMDWFYYSKDGKSGPTWNWRDEDTYYHTGIKDENGNEVILTGQKAVVIFEGYYNETLGEDDNLYGKGALLADVTVYGPKGADDIGYYQGFTMSSNPSKYGVIENGNYQVSRIGKNDKKGPYGSEWTLNKRGPVPSWGDFNPAFPNRDPAYTDGVFVHRSDNNGWAGERWDDKRERMIIISKGCLLILPHQWNAFNNQLKPVSNFLLQLRRR